MLETASPLMIDFLGWLSDRSRTYAEAMDAWRSTCPRHTVWEDALLGGLIQVQDSQVSLTPRGRELLDAKQRGS